MAESVTFNFRVLRVDRRPLSGREALAVLRYFVDRQNVPRGYRIEAIQWRRPHRAWRFPASAQKAEAAMLEHFWYILSMHGVASVRMGAVTT